MASRKRPALRASQKSGPKQVDTPDLKAEPPRVHFAGDEDVPRFLDVPRLAKQLQTVTLVDEAADEAHVLLGKYGKTSQLLKKRLCGDSESGFQTPKRHSTMFERAAEVVRSASKSCATPSSVTKKGLNTPLRKLQLDGSNSSATPIASRRRVGLRIARLKEDQDESSFSSSDSDDESVAEPDPDFGTPKATPKARADQRKGKENPELYFEAHGNSKIVTSDRTLTQLNTPRLSAEALRQALSNETLMYPKELRQLFEQHRSRFCKWMLLLHEGFNLLLYGFGSKKSVLMDFQTTMLPDQNCIVVNGFFPSLTLKQILNSITSEIMNDVPAVPATFASLNEHVDYICQNLSDILYVIVHNIDGSMLRGEKTQSMLAKLAGCPQIRLLCSIDHVNATLMWDQQRLSLFNFIWMDVTTFLPYTEETLNENSLMVKQSGKLALNSLARVFASLTPVAKSIFCIVVRRQIQGVEELGPQAYCGFSFKDLYRKCKKEFLVNSELTLSAQLVEFKDHKLMHTKKAADGNDYLFIPLDLATLNEFLLQQQSQDV